MREKGPTLVFIFTFFLIENFQKFTFFRLKLQQFVGNGKIKCKCFLCPSKCLQANVTLRFFVVFHHEMTLVNMARLFKGKRETLQSNIHTHTHRTAYRLLSEARIIDKVHQIIHRFVVKSDLCTYFFVISHF